MPTNDFRAFACGTSPNVLSQADYVASPTLGPGYQTGVASAAAVNKTLRQCSLIAAMIGQFIVDRAAANALDDGTIATLESNFIAGILQVCGTMDITIPRVDGLVAALAAKLDATANAVSASKLLAARNISLNGVVVGAVNFDGSGNVAITTTTTQLAKLAGAAFIGPVSSPSFNTTP